MFGAAGLVAFIAQAKYDSVILELITLSSALVLLVRVVLGYKRMNDRCRPGFVCRQPPRLPCRGPPESSAPLPQI